MNPETELTAAGNRPRREPWLALVVVLAAVAPGCRDERAGFDRFVPEPGAARAAVDATLGAWRAGKAPDVILGDRPKVHVVDKQRRAGQRLARYEVLGEVSAENARGFAVRLTFEGEEERPVVRYVVVGTDPIWVFRQEDYDMISHWTHPMTEPEDRAGGPGPAP